MRRSGGQWGHLDVGYHEGHQVAAGIKRLRGALSGCPAFPASWRALQTHGQILTSRLLPIVPSTLLTKHLQQASPTNMPNSALLNSPHTFSSRTFSCLRSDNSILPVAQSKRLIPSLLFSLSHLQCQIHEHILLTLLSGWIWGPPTSHHLCCFPLVRAPFSLPGSQ